MLAVLVGITLKPAYIAFGPEYMEGYLLLNRQEPAFLLNGAFLALVGLSMLSLAGLWLALGESTRPWLPYAFLGIYVSFFVANGFNQLIQGTLSGKLIRANRRGRLLAVAGLTGSVVSTTLAWFLMQRSQR